MVILAEGFDRVGKSTLVEQLKANGFQTFRSTKQINSEVNLEKAIQYDWRFMLDFLSQVNINICFDRSFISQYVYSMLLRKQSILDSYTEEQYEDIFKNYCLLLKKLNYKVIYCYREDFGDAIDENVDIKKSEDAHKLFLNFFNKHLDGSIIQCRFEDGIQTNYDRILKELR